MADPKYANLPGIDLNSKDVYECGSLAEDDQDWKPEELQSTSVEQINLDTQAAFEKFSGSYSGRIDFSKNEFGGYKKKQYDEDDETILQKYNRLRLEVSQLSQQVASINTAQKNQDNINLTDKVKDLEKTILSKDLQNIQTMNTPAAMDVEKALSAIKNLTFKGKGDTKTESDGKYEIYLQPKSEENSQKRFFELEQRLSKLEATIGLGKEDLSVLSDHSQADTLVGIVQNMETKLALLDPEKLPLVDTRLQSILTKVNEINKSKKAESNAEQNRKIDDLYKVIQKWDGTYTCLPAIQQRLFDLSVVQTKACSFMTTLQHLEDVQEQITAKLSKTEATQSSLKEVLKMNLEAVQANMLKLNERIDALTK